MPFVARAKAFLQNQGNLAGERRLPEMIESVRYMLDNAVGVYNAISTGRIVEHLQDMGYPTESREDWQINILGPLRRNGIFIGSKRDTGMFIIQDINDAKIVIEQIERRIDEETSRLEILRRMVADVGWAID